MTTQAQRDAVRRTFELYGGGVSPEMLLSLLDEADELERLKQKLDEIATKTWNEDVAPFAAGETP